MRHFAQRRWEVGGEVAERKGVGWGGEEDGEGTVEVVDVVFVEERRRRRKGMLGRR